MFSLSRVMRPSDYEFLANRLAVHDQVQKFTQVHPHQHPARRWDDAMTLLAIDAWRMNSPKEMNQLNFSDWGCGISLLPAILLYEGVKSIYLFEPWTYGDESHFVRTQMYGVEISKKPSSGQTKWYLLSDKLGNLHQEGAIWKKSFDVSLCLSTIEHIAEESEAFIDLLSTVKPGGLVFLTTDFAPADRPESSFSHAPMRTRMYNAERLTHLADLAITHGFRVFGGEPDWTWDESCRMVHDFGFASLCLIRHAEA